MKHHTRTRGYIIGWWCVVRGAVCVGIVVVVVVVVVSVVMFAVRMVDLNE